MFRDFVSRFVSYYTEPPYSARVHAPRATVREVMDRQMRANPGLDLNQMSPSMQHINDLIIRVKRQRSTQ